MTSEPDDLKIPTCFVIMPISDAHGYDQDHFARVYEQILEPAINAAGYNAIRADNTNKTDYIVVGIIQRIVQSDMVLCDFSAKNPNVMYELGIRHAFNKPVVLVKDRVTDKVFDIQGLRYTEYAGALRVDTVQKDIERFTKAARETASADANDVNSVIQLAGVKAAEVPAARMISADTQLILSAIASMDRSSKQHDRQSADPRFSRSDSDKVIFANETVASLEDEIYDADGVSIGHLIDIHPADGKIFVRNSLGKVTPCASISIKFQGLSTLPF